LVQTQKLQVVEQTGQKVVWSLNRHEEQFRLTLDPPQLGSIYIEIQREKEHIKATLWAENPNTKSVLEANQLSIQKIIEKEGFFLESFDVFVEQNLGSFQESRERKMNPESPVPILEKEIPRETIRAASSSTLPSRESRGLIGAIDLLV
jgi:flagellar hook-length control protein FliK